MRVVLALFLGLLAACRAVGADDGPIPEVRNVLLIVVDDLGYMDVGANNPDCFYRTPAIDALAASGVRFTDGYAASPVCSPTRFAILTGRHPTRAGATDWFGGRRRGRFAPAETVDRMGLEERTLAEVLKDEGLATFFAGKWHLGPTEEFWPERQGFDVNRGGHRRGGPYGGEKYFSPYGNPRLEDGPEGEHLPDRLASETIEFVREHADQPFLAVLSFYSVHTPLMAPESLVEEYRTARRERGLGDELVELEQVWPTDAPRRARAVQSHAVYAAMVESTDRAIGRVLDTLEELHLDESTLVVLVSDNGGLATSEGSPTSNLPFKGGKGWLYEGGIRVPFLMRWPGVTTPGEECSDPVSVLDILPTALDALGTLEPEPPLLLDGRSLRSRVTPPEFCTNGFGLENLLYWHYPHYSNQGGFPGAAVRFLDWKLIERFEDGAIELYDLREDPGELHDLSGSEPELVELLRDVLLHGWYEETGARFLEPLEEGAEPWRP